MSEKNKIYKRYMISWKTGIRNRQEGILNAKMPFMIIKNPRDGWIADPFLFEYEGKTFIFAEKWSYKKQKGSIFVAEFQGNADVEWIKAIEEEYHMSYPVLWMEGNDIFLCAETSEAGMLYSYKATKFPYEWEFYKMISKGKYVDTTPFFSDGKMKYFFTCELLLSGNRLLRGELNSRYRIDPLEWKYVTRNPMLARPGGAFLIIDGITYRVAQNCSDDYGQGITVCEVMCNDEYEYKERCVKYFSYENIKTDIPVKKVIGMHTYNVSKDYEVVDFRISRLDVKDLFGSVISVTRKNIVNTYEELQNICHQLFR